MALEHIVKFYDVKVFIQNFETETLKKTLNLIETESE